MDIKKLKALSQIVNSGSFCKAAQRLNYSQPGLTSMNNRLEEELGLTLLVRSSKGVKLTESGKELMPLIQELLTSNEKLEAALDRSREKKEAVIHVGAYASTALQWLPKAITCFQRDNPTVDVVVRTGLGQEILEWIENDSVDIALISKHFKADNEWISLKKDSFYAVVQKGTMTGKILRAYSSTSPLLSTIIITTDKIFYASL